MTLRTFLIFVFLILSLSTNAQILKSDLEELKKHLKEQKVVYFVKQRTVDDRYVYEVTNLFIKKNSKFTKNFKKFIRNPGEKLYGDIPADGDYIERGYVYLVRPSFMKRINIDLKKYREGLVRLFRQHDFLEIEYLPD